MHRRGQPKGARGRRTYEQLAQAPVKAATRYGVLADVTFVAGVEAVRRINETLAGGDPDATLEALKLPQAQLHEVDAKQKSHYHRLLKALKSEKAQVRVTSARIGGE